MPKVPLFWPSLVAAAVAIGVTAARGQQDLDAGKTGPQLFAQDCSACHRSPQGLVESMSGGSLVSFLRQHYTSSSASANALAGYLLSAAAPSRAPSKDQAGQAARDRAKAARPGETAAAPSSADAPGGALTPRKQRENLARPSDSPTDPQAKGSRKSRRAPAAEPAEATAPPASTEPAPTTAAVQPTSPSVQPTSAATPAEPVAARAAPPSGAGEAVARPAAPPSGFSEPLP